MTELPADPFSFTSHSEDETVARARDLAVLLGRRDGADTILCLHGDLGAGKSTFARALIRALCDDPVLEVPSPTFTLVQSYDGVAGPVFHFDLYRLKDPDEIWELGWEDALHPDAITVIEWPDRLGPYTPQTAQHLHFRRTGERLTVGADPSG